MPVIPALRRERQEDYKFKVILGDAVRGQYRLQETLTRKANKQTNRGEGTERGRGGE